MVLVLLRHGQTIWNKKNILAGSTKDVELSEYGINQSKEVCKILQKYNFDYVYTSNLKRTQDTCSIIKKELNQNFCIINSNKLNERNFGFLAGKDKSEIENIYGSEKIKKWLYSYKGIPPNGESTQDVSIRFGNYFDENILPLLNNNKNILIISHSYSLKALLIYLGLENSNNIEKLNINNCKPIEINLKNKFYSFL